MEISEEDKEKQWKR